MPSKKKTPARRSPSTASGTRKKSATKTSARAKAKSTTTRNKSRSSRKSTAGQASGWLDRLGRYGVLRSLLAATGVLMFIFATTPSQVPVYSGWPFVSTVLLPVLAPLIMMLLLLDALMGRVLMSDLSGVERARKRTTVIVNLILVAAVVLRWLPYYMSLGS